MIIAITALLSILVGLGVVAVTGIGVVASQLADLKAYIMTVIDLLQQIAKATK